jgi:transcriptional regulator with XRE-family HTH domain
VTPVNLFQAHRELLGSRIRTARKTAGLSHDQLAAKVGTSRQHLIKLEKGIHAPRPEMLAGIAEATGKSEEFFTGDGEDDEEADPVADLYSALMRAVDQRVADHLKSNEPTVSRQEQPVGSVKNGG